MKMHTFFLSGKAIAIVSGAFGACGMLLFVSGVLVGVRVQARVPDARVSAPAVPVLPAANVKTTAAGPSAPATAATTADAAVASANAPADAAWPFSSSSYVPEPMATGTQTAPVSEPVVPAPTPAPVTPAPVAPQPTRRGVAGSSGAVSMIAYVAPAQTNEVAAEQAPARAPRDDSAYLVQVGIFRVEQHAKELVDRLSRAGYSASITVRQEGDKSLHVVRVGRFTGIDAAEKAAARIGGSEQLVASVVVAKQ